MPNSYAPDQSPGRNIALIAVFAAFIAVLSPLALPIPGVPIPLALGPFAIYTTALVLGGFRAFIATLLYVLLGCLGLPIFAKGASGFGTLATPTGGYLLAYPLGALLAGTQAQSLAYRYPVHLLRYGRLRGNFCRRYLRAYDQRTYGIYPCVCHRGFICSSRPS